jgi:hypothetical protein
MMGENVMEYKEISNGLNEIIGRLSIPAMFNQDVKIAHTKLIYLANEIDELILRMEDLEK